MSGVCCRVSLTSDTVQEQWSGSCGFRMRIRYSQPGYEASSNTEGGGADQARAQFKDEVLKLRGRCLNWSRRNAGKFQLSWKREHSPAPSCLHQLPVQGVQPA